MRVLGADIDVAFGRAYRDACDGHAFDQEEGIAFHQHPVGERAAVAFVGVADDVLLIGLDAGGRAPFDPGGKACPSAPTQARGEHFLNRRLRAQRQRALQASKAAMVAIFVERQRVRQSASSEYEPLLFCEVRDVVNAPQRLGVRPTTQEGRLEQLSRLACRDRPVADAPRSGLDLNERL